MTPGGFSFEAPWPWAVLAIGVLVLALAVWQLVSQRGRRLAWTRRSALIVLALAMAMRPALPGAEVPTASIQARVMILVDTSQSIAAEDFGDETRLSGMQDDIEQIARVFSGADLSVISFDSEAVLRVPLTDDGSAVIEMVKALRPEIAVRSRGTSVAAARDLLLQELQRSAEAEPDSPATVFYLGDGEHTATGEPQSFEDIAPLVSNGLVLGYGTEEGGRMQVSGFAAGEDPEYVQDPAGGDAKSSIDEKQLGAIAEQLGLTYLKREPGVPIEEALAPMAVEAGEAEADSTERARLEFAWLFAIPVAMLLAWEGFSLARSLRATRGAFRGSES